MSVAKHLVVIFKWHKSGANPSQETSFIISGKSGANTTTQSWVVSDYM